jgi:hypothetical protein
MVRPAGRQLARRADTLEDLREEFLAHCEARNLSGRTLEWYADRALARAGRSRRMRDLRRRSCPQPTN